MSSLELSSLYYLCSYAHILFLSYKDKLPVSIKGDEAMLQHQ